jgi:hypothetical protein
MNPNRLTRETRKLPGNIRSPKLPGGTLISAVLDRHLMAWSDRGGASRIFGEVWSEHCWTYLTNGARIFRTRSYDHANAIVIRLDDNPKIAIQAGRNKLPNPDFIILHRENNHEFTVRAVDAKFAVDRLRRTQISPESMKELIELPGSLAREAISQNTGSIKIRKLDYQPGLFLGPSSLLNDYFYRQLTGGEHPEIPSDELHLLPVESLELFRSVDEFPLLELFKDIDELRPGNRESELVLDMYYLRLASAARWFESQIRLPLLTNEPEPEIAVDEIVAAAQGRIERGESAYGLIESWSQAAESAQQRHKLVQNAARLPVRMSEIRDLVVAETGKENKRIVRKVRGILDQDFLSRLIAQTGVIPASGPEKLTQVTDRVQESSRSLRRAMLEEMQHIVTRVAAAEADD